MAVTALLAVVFAPMAFAVNKQCTLYSCCGTNYRDTLYERGGNGVLDSIIG